MKDLTLASHVAKIPVGGLMNPNLRHISVNVKRIKPMAAPKCGKFGNVLGKRK